MKTAKIPIDVQMIINDWKRRIGNRPGMVSEELQRAVLAQCVMCALIIRSGKDRNTPVGDYVDLYFAAQTALRLSDSDSSEETQKYVGTELGI